MAGTCITTIKVLGASSLGLLTGSLVYQSIQSIPLLINKLQYEVAISSTELLSQIKLIITVSRVSNLVFGSISSGLLWLAYLASSSRDKHPYIIYSTFSIPIALATLYYQSYKYESKLLSKSTIPVVPEATPAPAPAPVSAPQLEESSKSDDETESLGKSYIHVSDGDDSSANSTPNSTTPSSPKTSGQPEGETPQKLTISEASKELSIEEEVENALFKKEVVQDLQKVKSGYLVGSSITGLGFLMVVVGIIGDTYFL